MPRFSERSESRLRTCDVRLQVVFHRVIETVDCTVLEGHRSRERHAEHVRAGRTRVAYEGSKHSPYPSVAVDVAPYPIDWAEDGDPKALGRYYFLAGFVLAIAEEEGIGLRWGGDWDGDHEFRDQSFDDLVHFELLD